MASSNQVLIYAPVGSELSSIFAEKKERPSSPITGSFFGRLLKEFENSAYKPPSPQPPSPPKNPGICFSDLSFLEEDETEDYDEPCFDWSAWRGDLLKMAWEIGVPQPGSEQYDSTMKHLKQNPYFMTLHFFLDVKRAMLKNDASLGPILDKIESDGPEAIKRYWNDKDVLYELGVELGVINLGNDDDDKLLTDTFASFGMVYEPSRSLCPTEDDWDDIRMRLFVMVLVV